MALLQDVLFLSEGLGGFWPGMRIDKDQDAEAGRANQHQRNRGLEEKNSQNHERGNGQAYHQAYPSLGSQLFDQRLRVSHAYHQRNASRSRDNTAHHSLHRWNMLEAS